MPFYERGDVRIHYEEVGSGFPLMIIPGGGLNSAFSSLPNHPFNPMEEFKGEYRCITADLRNWSANLPLLFSDGNFRMRRHSGGTALRDRLL